MSAPIDPEDFLSTSSSSGGNQRARTATWNYVATVRKATAVTHSCVGCFTGPNHLNLIICKGSHVEIYHMIENELHLILDFPVVGKVVFMELFRQPHTGTTDTSTR
ncbi:PREDICTED: DNA damage-binding protein 1-like [Camelina sativa]|uniref:DNA damage-binding protein 1-like n=1 Tax=Camelina sativa TaxID=90675 RepID=A0ABM0VG45_CAMSA|nr:PREDICTED: DNA damage-binding protein 1-like [Camelina sativa]XP_010455653.1 PREDICTED: DNA damage-binding protein 1-like [Camelina sativa]